MRVDAGQGFVFGGQIIEQGNQSDVLEYISMVARMKGVSVRKHSPNGKRFSAPFGVYLPLFWGVTALAFFKSPFLKACAAIW